MTRGISFEDFDALITAVSTTVLDRDAWPQTLAAIKTAFDCSVASLNTFGSGRYASISTDPLASAEWVRHWTYGNPLSAGRMAVGSVALARDIVDHDTFVASAYYNEFLLPLDIPQVMTIRGPFTDTSGAVFNLLRGRRQPEFTRAELTLAERLSGHIVTAWRAATMLGWKSWTDFTASLETAGEGMILVDVAGKVLHMNRAARGLTEARDGVVTEARSLGATSCSDDKRLRRAIWLATAGPAPQTSTMLTIQRASGERPLIASITPLKEKTVDLGTPTPRALIAVLDSTRTPPASSVDLRLLFGLTRREVDIAQALGQGLSIAEAAMRCGVTIVTARNYLARVLLKTQVNRQGELVRLLNGLSRLADASHRGKPDANWRLIGPASRQDRPYSRDDAWPSSGKCISRADNRLWVLRPAQLAERSPLSESSHQKLSDG